MKKNQYIVYIDNEWVKLRLFNRYGRTATLKEQFDFMADVRRSVMDFINGRVTDENRALFVEIFIGPDGYRRRAIDIVCLPGSESSTKPLKRVKKLRRLKKIGKH